MDERYVPRPLLIVNSHEVDELRSSCILDELEGFSFREYHCTLNSPHHRGIGAHKFKNEIICYVWSIKDCIAFRFCMGLNKKDFLHAHVWILTARNVPYFKLRTLWYHNCYVTAVKDRAQLFKYQDLHCFRPSFIEDEIPYELGKPEFLLKK